MIIEQTIEVPRRLDSQELRPSKTFNGILACHTCKLPHISFGSTDLRRPHFVSCLVANKVGPTLISFLTES